MKLNACLSPMQRELQMWNYSRIAWFGLGCLFILTACLAETIGLSDQGSGFGRGETALAVLGMTIAVVAFLDRRNYWVPRLMLAVTTTYAVLLATDVVFRSWQVRKNPFLGLVGMYVNDDDVGVRLAPNWRGISDDGWVTPEYRTNSLGHRDDEPVPTHGAGILLLGDSFTFGMPLEGQFTIDKQIERLSDHAIDAYNTGVPGVGPPQILEYFRRCDWFDGRHAVYLFCHNDVYATAQVADFNTVVDGYLAMQYYPLTLKPMPLETIKQNIADGTAEKPTEVGPFFKLHHLRSSIINTIRHYKLKHGLMPPTHAYPTYDVANTVRVTEEMRQLARERNLTFHVLIIPSRDEALAQRYSAEVAEYVAELKQRKFDCIEILHDVSLDDYGVHDAHFSNAGAELTAARILSSLGTDVANVASRNSGTTSR